MQPVAIYAPSGFAALPNDLLGKVAGFVIDPANYFSTKAIFYVSKKLRRQEDGFIEQVAIRDLVVGSVLRKAAGELENMSPRFQEFIKKVRKSVHYFSLSGIPIRRHVLRTITETSITVLGCRRTKRTLLDQRISLNPQLTVSQIRDRLMFTKIIQQGVWVCPSFIAKREIIPRQEVVSISILPELLRLFPSIKTVDTGDFEIFPEDCQLLSMCRNLSTIKLGSNPGTQLLPQKSTSHLTHLLDAEALTDLDISDLGSYYVPPAELFGKMGRLRSLSMMVNEHHKTRLIGSVATLTRLERLTIKGYNTFSNRELLPLGALTELRELSLAAYITMEINEPFFFAPFTKLEKLCLFSIEYNLPRFLRGLPEQKPVIDLGELLRKNEKLKAFVMETVWSRIEFTLNSLPQQATLEKLFLFGSPCSAEMLRQCASLSSLSAFAYKTFFDEKETGEYEALAKMQSLQTLLITGIFPARFRKEQLERVLRGLRGALKKLPRLQTFGLYLDGYEDAIKGEVERIVKQAIPNCAVHIVTECEPLKDLPKFFLSQI